MHEKTTTERLSMETTGIDQVPEQQQTGRPIDLFWIWCGANIGILGVVYGAIIVAFGLSFIQSILAALVGISSFVLVGIASFAGQRGRTSTLTLSRVIFGLHGNIAPTLFSWINLMDWEAVNVITGTLTMAALFQTLGFSESPRLIALSLLLFSGLTILVSLAGQQAVVFIQSWISRIFGSMTLVVVLYIVLTAPWHQVLALPSGSWLTGFLPAVSVIAAGTGISWAIAGADYSRYQNASTSSGHIFSAVVAGACVPLLLLMFTGILLSTQLPDLAAASNPIMLIGSALPSWMSVPYLLAATAGIATIAVLSLYSASLNLLTIGVRIGQLWAVSLDALLMLAVAIYVLFFSGDFLEPFISFLLFCGVFLAAWEAIFILDYLCLRRQQGYQIQMLYGLTKTHSSVRMPPLFIWLFGAISGLMVTKTGFIDGVLAKGIFAQSSLGLFVSFFVSLGLYALYLIYESGKNASQ